MRHRAKNNVKRQIFHFLRDWENIYFIVEARRTFRNPERLFLCLVVMKFYFLLRYAAKANANAPKTAAYVAGSGTLVVVTLR